MPGARGLPTGGYLDDWLDLLCSLQILPAGVDFEQRDAPEIEIQPAPLGNRQLQPVTEQGADDAGVGDEGDAAATQTVDAVKHARLQHRRRFAARRDEVQQISSPGVEQLAIDLLPGDAFPFAKVDLQQAFIEQRLRMQGLGQAARTPQRAGNDRRRCGQQRTQTLGDRLRVLCFDIELAVADTDGKPWSWVADQEKLHNSPQ